MTVRLVCGPPGAGKNHYVDAHKKEGDTIIDLDLIRQHVPDDETARRYRNALEASAHAESNDTWVIRSLAEKNARQSTAERIKASEVIVIATPADVALDRAQKRDPSKDLSEPINRWWKRYTPSDRDLVVTPDTGIQPDKEKHKMGKKDKGFPDNTPLVEMTAEQQLAYWKFHARKHEDEKNTNANDAQKWRDHLAAQQNGGGNNSKGGKGDEKDEQNDKAPTQADIQRLIDEAVARDRLENKKKDAPARVRDAFKSEAKGVPEDVLDTFLGDDFNFNVYVDDKGELIDSKVKDRAGKLVEKFGSSTGDTRQRRQAPKPNHQGERQSTTTARSTDVGRDLFDRTHNKNSKKD